MARPFYRLGLGVVRYDVLASSWRPVAQDERAARPSLLGGRGSQQQPIGIEATASRQPRLTGRGLNSPRGGVGRGYTSAAVALVMPVRGCQAVSTDRGLCRVLSEAGRGGNHFGLWVRFCNGSTIEQQA
jgi:hypothetical protein